MVQGERLAAVTGEEEPQTHVGVPGVDTHRAGHGQEGGPLVEGAAVDAELLLGFSAGRPRGLLARFDVAAGRQPQRGVDVVDQKDAAIRAINRYDVRHQVAWRCGRLDPPVDVVSASQPPQHVGSMVSFQFVCRQQRGDEVVHDGDRGKHAPDHRSDV